MVQLEKDLEGRLRQLSEETGRSESAILREAVLDYLETYEDYRIAVERLENDTGRVTLEEIERELRRED